MIGHLLLSFLLLVHTTAAPATVNAFVHTNPKATPFLIKNISKHKVSDKSRRRGWASQFHHHSIKLTSSRAAAVAVTMTENEESESAVATDVEENNENPPYDKETFAAYASVMEEVLQSRRILRNIKNEDLQKVSNILLQNKHFVPASTTTISTSIQGDELRKHMSQTKDTFLQNTRLTCTQYKIALMALTYMGDYCAKKSIYKPLTIAWNMMKDGGMIIRDKAYGTYLYVLSNLDEEEDGVAEEVAMVHDVLFQPDEKTISVRVKSMVARGDDEGAMKLLTSLPNGGDVLKQRTYLPVLQSYCSKGNIPCALKLYKQMKDSPSVIFEAGEQAMFIAAVAKAGFFRSDSEAVKGAEDIGYSPAHGPKFFDQLVLDMANDVLEISSSAALKLYDAFSIGFRGLFELSNGILVQEKGTEAEGVEEEYNESSSSSTPEMVLMNDPAKDGELVVSRVKVNRTTAVCPRTNATLRLIMLEPEQRKQLHETLLEMADTQYREFEAKTATKRKKGSGKTNNNNKKNKKSDDPNYAAKELSKFVEWLDTREGDPFTAIVDGANVAYFGQGYVDYLQLKLMVETLETMKEKPLVIMPQKYTNPKFRVGTKFVQKLTPEDQEIINSFDKEKKIFKVPALCLDDYYWMLASVSDQTISRNGTNIDVPTNSADNRWPGLRPMLISNDQMRDHKLELLEPRLFRRWCSSHIVNYSIRNNKTEIGFFAADFFSREIQGNPTPLSSSVSLVGEEGGGGTAWHFPVSDWDVHERLCIRIPFH